VDKYNFPDGFNKVVMVLEKNQKSNELGKGIIYVIVCIVFYFLFIAALVFLTDLNWEKDNWNISDFTYEIIFGPLVINLISFGLVYGASYLFTVGEVFVSKKVKMMRFSAVLLLQLFMILHFIFYIIPVINQ
jgi:hypothetical protein